MDKQKSISELFKQSEFQLETVISLKENFAGEIEPSQSAAHEELNELLLNFRPHVR